MENQKKKGGDDDKLKLKKKKEILSTSILYTTCKRINEVDQGVDTVVKFNYKKK